MKLNILHVSDLHISDESIHDIQVILKALISDLKLLSEEKGLKPDLVFFTGDIIRQGSKGEAELLSADQYFIEPLLSYLGLPRQRLFHSVSAEVVASRSLVVMMFLRFRVP